MNEDLGAILRTIREVEVSLERRTARAQGVLLMIWGACAASIFGFYQLVKWNHDPYVDALGEGLNWVWVGPIVVAYVASALVGARLGRLGATPEQRRHLRRGAIPALIITGVVTALILTERYHYIYGAVTLLSGVACIAFAWNKPHDLARSASFGVGAALSAVGLALVPFAGSVWAPGVAALAFLVGYLLLGTVLYRLGR